MGAKWITKIYGFVPSSICIHIDNIKKIDNKGNVTFTGFGFKEFEVILHSMLEFPTDISEYETRRIVSKSLFNVGKKGQINPEKFLKEINFQIGKIRRESIQRYALATSISIDKSSNIKRLFFDNNIVIFESPLSKSFRPESQKLISKGSKSLLGQFPKNYLHSRIHVSARSIHEASNKALDAIDFVRGIWNWVINRRQYFRYSLGGKPKPINKIILGPIHTLHFPNGNIASDSVWWYESSFIESVKPIKFNKDELSVLSKSYNFVKESFQRHNYPDLVKHAIIRYTRALDERIWSTAFIKMWGVLELLTDTVGQSYETTVKRASYMFEDRDYNYQVLQHLRKYRNSLIHHDSENSEVESYLYQLKNNVDILLDFHIANRFHFESIQDASSFLSLPLDKLSINKRMSNLEKSLKFRGY